jgi:hypothetical protein
MIKKITKSINFLQGIFSNAFSFNSHSAVEVLLMMASGHIFDIFTPNQLAQTLCLDKNKVYSAIKGWSIFLSRKLLFFIGCHIASKIIKDTINKSPATLSRMRITINVDDTVVNRMGKLISLTYSWFSSKHNNPIRGQNIIAITIKIGDRIIPLNVRPVSKQGRGNTSKPAIFRDMLGEVLSFFQQEGIDLTKFPITFDSWYGSKKLVDILSEKRFTTILIHSKSNYVFTIDGKKQKLSAHKKEIEFNESAWGCDGIPVARKAAESPTFGKVLLLFFKDGEKVKCVMVFGRKLRASEIMSIWKQHHSIECFWRRLKTDLQIHKVRMRDREGVYAMVGIKVVAYLLMEDLSFQTGLTFHQFKIQAKREIDICSFFSEHFHSLMASKSL